MEHKALSTNQFSIEDFKKHTYDVIDLNSFFHSLQFQNKKSIKNQTIYMLSEIEELKEALQGDNISLREMLDAIGDIFVTSIYLVFLVSKDETEFQQYLSNLKEHTPKDITQYQNKEIFYEKYSQVIKYFLLSISSKYYIQTEDEKSFLFNTPEAAILYYCVDNINEQYQLLFNSERIQIFVQQIYNLLFFTNFFLLNNQQWNLNLENLLFKPNPINYLLLAIKNSNFSKIIPENNLTPQDIQDNIHYIKNELSKKKQIDPEQIHVSYKKVKDCILFFDEDTQKILKPKTFKEPNLEIFDHVFYSALPIT